MDKAIRLFECLSAWYEGFDGEDMRIGKPRVKPTETGYVAECEEMLAPVFHDLIDLAEQRGWNGDAVATALLSLAQSNAEQRQLNGRASE